MAVAYMLVIKQNRNILKCDLPSPNKIELKFKTYFKTKERHTHIWSCQMLPFFSEIFYRKIIECRYRYKVFMLMFMFMFQVDVFGVTNGNSTMYHRTFASQTPSTITDFLAFCLIIKGNSERGSWNL